MHNRRSQNLTPEEKELLKQLGQRLTALVQKKGWNPGQSRNPHFRNWGFTEIQMGHANPRLLTLIDIAKELGTTVSELLKDLV